MRWQMLFKPQKFSNKMNARVSFSWYRSTSAREAVVIFTKMWRQNLEAFKCLFRGVFNFNIEAQIIRYYRDMAWPLSDIY